MGSDKNTEECEDEVTVSGIIIVIKNSHEELK